MSKVNAGTRILQWQNVPNVLSGAYDDKEVNTKIIYIIISIFILLRIFTNNQLRSLAVVEFISCDMLSSKYIKNYRKNS